MFKCPLKFESLKGSAANRGETDGQQENQAILFDSPGI